MTSGTDDDDYEDEDIPDEDEDGGSGPGFLTTPAPSEGEPGIHFLCNYILSFDFQQNSKAFSNSSKMF